MNTLEKHRNEPHKSFDQYLRELRLQLGHEIVSCKKIYLGGSDNYQQEIKEALIYLFEKETGKKAPSEEVKEANGEQEVACLIRETVKRNKLGVLLPSLIIPCGLHASIRQDVNRQYKPHDVFDIRHAESFLFSRPSCQIRKITIESESLSTR